MKDRLENIPALFQKAKNARTVVESEWTRMNDYYNFIHDASAEMKDFCEMRDIPYIPAVCPDAWIAVESQIDPTIPTPEFRGRDTDRDSVKAKQREFAVKYMIENNDIDQKNTANERRLRKLGDAFWKAYWDVDMRCGISEGDIRILDVSPEAIFPDASLRTGDIQQGQYVAYVYTLHKVEFLRQYKKRLKALGKTDVQESAYVPVTSCFDLSTAVDDVSDTVQVMEFWFKWPEDGLCEMPDGKKVQVRAGDVACSIQAGDIELKLIPQYWKHTGRQCRLFPFVHYWCIRDENSFWNKSELYPIMDLIDAQDRKLGSALLNDAFMSNDVVIYEEGALADGEEFSNAPGASVRLKNGKIGSVARLGGLQNAPNATIMLNYLKEQVERTSRNYETNLGKETSRQTTASGLAMLREDADSQSRIKNADRQRGFERLYELLDWLALEWYDDNRMLYLGATEERAAEALSFNSLLLAETSPAIMDAVTGKLVREEFEYWPKVDVTVTAGDGVMKGKQATLTALQTLANAAITAENYKLYEAMLDILDIPQKQDIISDWETRFGGNPEELTAPAGMTEAAGIF